jgi:heme ABC exporter ATP-binding subunit CcmA
MPEETAANLKNWSIETKALTKSFDERPVLRGVNLRIESGEHVALLGPNGAGKTTLIKILSTIMYPTSGKVMVCGLDASEKSEEVRRRIGVVSHSTYLYNNLTAFENLDFYRRLYDVPVERIGEVADMVGMKLRLHDRVNTLSRGMQQRFSIARALLHNPGIMLLDEPETGLDQQAISLLWEIFRSEKEGRRTLVLTTHNLERSLELADRFLILSRGKIAYQESRQALDLEKLKQAYQQSTRVKV